MSSPSAPSRSAAVQAYEQHLAALGRDRPHLLLAHVFTQVGRGALAHSV